MKDDKHVVGYFLAMLPLTMAHLCIPPLSTFTIAPEQPPEPLKDLFLLYRQLAPGLQGADVVQGMLLDPKQPPDATVLTHLFVHATYTQLLGNLTQVLLLAWPVYRAVGTPGVYGVFVSGGVIGSANVQQLLQREQSLAVVEHEQDLLTWASSVASVVIQDVLSLMPVCAGSSGAVYALYGCNLLLSVQQMVIELTSPTPRPLQMAKHALSLWACGTMVMHEISLAELPEGLKRVSPKRITGQTAHLRGCAVGAVMMAVMAV